MVHIHRIDSLELPEVAPYRGMRHQQAQREEGIFVAESDKVVQRLLASDFEVVSLLLPEKWLARFEPLLSQRAEDIQVYLLEKQQLEQLTGFSFYQGVMAVGRIPKPPALQELLHRRGPRRLLAAVEGITSAENLGGLVRSCAAFGVQGLLLDRTSASAYLRRAVRASMGTIFRVPVIERLELVEIIPLLRKEGFRCIAAHPHAQGSTLAQTNFSSDSCIVFGSEGYGISPDLLAACDEAISIPMAPDVDSLNVGSAAAVFLYEASRHVPGR